MILSILFFTFFSFQDCEAYTHTKTEEGNKIKWNQFRSPLILKYSKSIITNENDSFSKDDYVVAIEEAINNWNSINSLQVQLQEETSLPPVGVENTIRFTSDAAYFGPGVLGVTAISYNLANGEIQSSDILLNSSYFRLNEFTGDKSKSSGSEAYIGDIITHELGHFFGLGHSEAVGASMILSIFKGQHTIELDDRHAIKSLYSSESSYQDSMFERVGQLVQTQGEIIGSVYGGKNQAVFGVNVQLINVLTGQTVTSVLSDEEGRFQFSNISEGKYVIYYGPAKSVSNLPQYYSEKIEYNQCAGGSVVSSFYSGCGGRDKGKAQIIDFTGENFSNGLSVGVLGIKCSDQLNSEYLAQKLDGFSAPIDLYPSGQRGEQIVGYFDQDKIMSFRSESIKDVYDIDLTGYSAQTDEKLRLSFVVENLGASFQPVVTIKNNFSNITSNYSTVEDSETQKINLNLIVELPLSSNSVENDFTVSLYPLKLNSDETLEIFSSFRFVEKSQKYLFSSMITSGTLSNPLYIAGRDISGIQDNLLCLEGSQFVSKEELTNTASSQEILRDSNQASVLSCATVSTDNTSGPGGGLMSLLIGFSFIILLRIKRLDSPYSLS